MNLDELKIQLNEQIESDTGSHRNIAEILKRNPSSMVGGILRNLRLEIFFSIIFTVGCVYAAFTNEFRSLRMYSGIFSFLGAAFIIILSYLYNRIKKYEQRSLSVRENLTQIVNIIQTYCKYYFRFSIALLPISVFLAFALGFSDDPTKVSRFIQWKFLMPFSLIIVAGGILLYYANKWTINKLYGRYTEQLKNHLKELNEKEETL